MHKKSRERGQSLTEYVLLVGIVAIGSIWTLTKLGETIKTTAGNMVNVLTGQPSESIRQVAPVSKHHMGRTDLFRSIRKEPRTNDN